MIRLRRVRGSDSSASASTVDGDGSGRKWWLYEDPDTYVGIPTWTFSNAGRRRAGLPVDRCSGLLADESVDEALASVHVRCRTSGPTLNWRLAEDLEPIYRSRFLRHHLR